MQWELSIPLTFQVVAAQIQDNQAPQASQCPPIDAARVHPEASAAQLNPSCPPPNIQRYPVKIAQPDPGPADCGLVKRS